MHEPRVPASPRPGGVRLAAGPDLKQNAPIASRPTESGPRCCRAAAALLLSCGLLLAACGGDGGTTTSGPAPAGQSPQPQAGASTAPQSAGDTRGPAPDDTIHDKPGGAGQGGVRPSGGGGTGERPPSSADKGRIERTVKAYVAALDADDGATLCRRFAPGALHGVKLPVHRGTCAATLTASVGHRGEPGAPRWLGTKLVDADTVVLVRGGDGRFTGTVVHTLAGREPSIEDDVVYLRKVNGTWLIAKPSASFYRAIGARDVPVTALAPPR
jgi:hypothetical protein